MRSLTIALFALLGIIVTLVALSQLIAGPLWIPGAGADYSATLDSQIRFGSVLMLAYGSAMWWCSQDLERHQLMLHILLLVLFVGGLARLVSIYAVGQPHPLTLALIGVELLIPPPLAALLSKTVKTEALTATRPVTPAAPHSADDEHRP